MSELTVGHAGWSPDFKADNFRELSKNLRSEGQMSRADAVDWLIEQANRRAPAPDALVETLRKALEFYADPTIYEETVTPSLPVNDLLRDEIEGPEILGDCGSIARAALAAPRPECTYGAEEVQALIDELREDTCSDDDEGVPFYDASLADNIIRKWALRRYGEREDKRKE